MPERTEAVSRLWDCGSPSLPFALCARHWLIRDAFLQQCAGVSASFLELRQQLSQGLCCLPRNIPPGLFSPAPLIQVDRCFPRQIFRDYKLS